MTQRKPPQNRPRRAARGRAGARRRPAGHGDSALWLFGTHPVLEALANPRRRLRRVLATDEAIRRHGQRIDAILAARPEGAAAAAPIEVAERATIAAPLPESAVHQGLAAWVEPLTQGDPAAILALAAAPPAALADRGAAPRLAILVLDRITDPHNVGAILRSASAFGAAAVLGPKDHAPAESGALAKAASGALEHVPYIRVTNLARTLAAAKAAGWWCLGLAETGAQDLAHADSGGPVALVLGAEGTGLRRLSADACDALVRLPTGGPIGTLNVSNAAAVALYALMNKIV